MFVELHRGSIVESRHRVHVAVVDRAGALVKRAGDPDLVTFMRSAAKPFQAMPLVTDGVLQRFGLTSAELALSCASHSSEPAQVSRVRAYLQRIGCTEADLLCGPHVPLSDRVAREYEAQAARLTAVHSNCSGKHAGMLALARHHGWPTAGYVRAEHPVQRRCLDEVARWTAVPAEQVGTAVDGCAVVCFAVPLRSFAMAYARLAGGGSEAAVVAAMVAHPELVGGEGRPCTEIMRAHPGRVVTKVGAEGVYGALLITEGLGVALKVEDGHNAAATLALATVLDDLGLAPPPSLMARPVLNSVGDRVGELRVNGGLTR